MNKVFMIGRWLRILTVGLLVPAVLLGQEEVTIKKKEFKTGVEIGFKEAWSSVKEGDKQFKEGRGTFDLARDYYLYANQYNPDNAELNYKIGACYLFTDDKYIAIDYLLRAYDLNEEVSQDIHLLLGNAYQLVLEFEEAASHFKEHKLTLDEDEQEIYSSVLAKRLTECQHGRSLSQDPVRVILQNLGENMNSKYDDYNPIFAYGDSALYFSSRRPFGKAKRNPLDNKYNEDIYRSTHSGSGFEMAVRLGKPFNTENNEAVVGVSADGNKLLIYRGYEQNGKLEIITFNPEKAKWSRSKVLDKKLLSKDGETSAALSADGSELFYVSRNARLTAGGKDILYTRLNEKGKWEEPRNIGGLINTPYDEEGVFITADGKYLYFASQGHNSMGGFDIFRSGRSDNGGWTAPENLGYPINTPDDEVLYIMDKNGDYGYYSTIREGGLGSKDIFKVVFLGSEKELVTSMKDQLVAGPGETKRGFLTKPRLPNLDTSIIVTGRVLDTLDGVRPVMASLSYMDPQGAIQEVRTVTNDSGVYVANLPEATIYGVEINATGYLYFLDVLDLLGESGEEKVVQDFYLQKIEVGTKVVLENIYFQTGKAVLRPESNNALDQVVRFLQNNPGMKLEISGHTDNTGTLRINQKLSRDRAKSVVNYLVGRGIPETMLVYEGYADSQPVAPNDTAEGREKNRRVEFKVLSN
jgi:outer membrane protein OmpA-like peptidoglycan-associated protein/tetratricopeptide (TPR) repeat protein